MSMNLTEVRNKLQQYVECCDHDIDYLEQHIKNLIKELDKDISLSFKAPKDRKRITFCLKKALKTLKGYRPVLGFSKFDETGKQIFTDGSFLVSLTREDQIPELPDVAKGYVDEKINIPAMPNSYPQTDTVCKTSGYDGVCQVNVDELYKAACLLSKTDPSKLDAVVSITPDPNRPEQTIAFTARTFINAYMFGNLMNEGLMSMLYKTTNNIAPIHFIKHNGTHIVITQVRH